MIPINKIFQSRCEDKITKFLPPPNGCAGAVQRNPDGTIQAGFEPALNARGRTVRLHEADHLRYHTPKDHKRRFITEARKEGMTDDNIFQTFNALEDSFISTMPVWEKRPLSVLRDAAATVLRETRRAYRHAKPILQSKDTHPSMRNYVKTHLFNVSLRAISLAKPRAFSTTLCAERAAKLLKDCDTILNVSLGNLARDLQHGRLADARHKAIQAMRPTPLPKLDLPQPDLPPFDEMDPDYEQPEDDSRYGMTTHGEGTHGEGIGPEVKIVRPPLTCPCDLGLDGEPLESYGSSGYRLRRSALVPIGIGIPCSSPFIRTSQPSPSGVVLLDASGSMHLSADMLRRLCKASPASTVIYYSGDDCNGEWARIVIYAKDGRRLDDSIPLPDVHQGNVCDELALRYALKCRADQGSAEPLIFISDLGFNGNTKESHHRAHEIVTRGVQDGSIEVIGNSDAALARFEFSCSDPHDN